MAKDNVITEESFDELLSWLDRNREIAAAKYEKIRRSLIRIFTGRGCFEAEELADETFDRVARKLPQLAENYTGEPTRYFYGVADKIHLEWLHKQKKTRQLNFLRPDNQDKTELEIESQCLDDCLKKLPAEQHRLIVAYYQKTKSAKIENRRKLADDFGVSAGALQIKTFRIRVQLRECLRNCIAEKK